MTGGMAAHFSKVRSLVTRMRNISGRNEPSDDSVVAVLLKSVRHVASFKPLCKVLREKPDCSLEDVVNQLEDREREDLLDEEEEANVSIANVSIGPKTKFKPKSTTLNSQKERPVSVTLAGRLGIFLQIVWSLGKHAR